MSDNKKDKITLVVVISAIMLGIQFGGHIFAKKGETASKEDVKEVKGLVQSLNSKVEEMDGKVDDMNLELKVYIATHGEKDEN